jgi:hypothetical protein
MAVCAWLKWNTDICRQGNELGNNQPENRRSGTLHALRLLRQAT